VDVAVRLYARALRIVLGGVSYTRRCGCSNLARSDAPGQPLRLLPLQLFQHLFDGYRVEDVLGCSGQDGEDGKGAVFLVLFEPSSEAMVALAFVVTL
jgi:hypothetical protein